MTWSFTFGSIAGTAIRVHVTFFLLLLWIAASAWAQGGEQAALRNLVFIIALFACVLAHEFGHIFAARIFGIRTPVVTLLPIGGVASLERIPEEPRQSLIVALAGPAVNVVIAFLLAGVFGATMPDRVEKIDDHTVSLVSRLMATNLFLALFNMIPAFPMDGGRVLHALLAMRMGNARAIQIAARIGQAVAFLLGFIGLFGNPMLIFIAIFVYVAAAGEAQQTVFRDAVRGLSVTDAMETGFAKLEAGATLADAVDLLLATPQRELPVVDGHGKLIGILSREDLIKALVDKPRDAPVVEVMRPAGDSLRLGGDLEAALQTLGESDAGAIGVTDADGRLVGLLTRENVAEMMMIKAAQPEWKFQARR